jgi:hypothetical protein
MEALEGIDLSLLTTQPVIVYITIALVCALMYYTMKSGFALVSGMVCAFPLATLITPLLYQSAYVGDALTAAATSDIIHVVVYAALCVVFTIFGSWMFKNDFGTSGRLLQSFLLAVAAPLSALASWGLVPSAMKLYPIADPFSIISSPQYAGLALCTALLFVAFSWKSTNAF